MSNNSDTAGPLTAWDRVANNHECKTFVFTVIAVHLGLSAEDRDRRPWSLIAPEIVGQMVELTELWKARRFWSRHAQEVIDELRQNLTDRGLPGRPLAATATAGAP